MRSPSRTCARCGKARCPRHQTCAPPRRRVSRWCAPLYARLVGPLHQLGELARQLGLDGRTTPSMIWPVLPSSVIESPTFKVMPPADIVPLAHRCGRRPRPRHELAHAARHHGGVAGHAAGRGQDALGCVHAVDVLGAGFAGRGTFSPSRLRYSASSAVKTMVPCSARRGRQAAIEHLAIGLGISVGCGNGRARPAPRAPPLLQSIRPSRTIRRRFIAPQPCACVSGLQHVGLPLCTVNSMSCMSR